MLGISRNSYHSYGLTNSSTFPSFSYYDGYNDRYYDSYYDQPWLPS